MRGRFQRRLTSGFDNVNFAVQTSMSQLSDYLLELAADPDRCARFKADPQTELGGTELSEDEKGVLASRDPRAIADALVAAGPDSAAVLQWLFSQFKETVK